MGIYAFHTSDNYDTDPNEDGMNIWIGEWKCKRCPRFERPIDLAIWPLILNKNLLLYICGTTLNESYLKKLFLTDGTMKQRDEQPHVCMWLTPGDIWL